MSKHTDYHEHYERMQTDSPYCTIRLTKEPYTNVVVELGKTLKVLNPDTPVLEFEYDVVARPETVNAELLLHDDFNSLLGGILLAILERHFQEGPTQ